LTGPAKIAGNRGSSGRFEHVKAVQKKTEHASIPTAMNAAPRWGNARWTDRAAERLSFESMFGLRGFSKAESGY
jgi:hypothetical protein